MQYQYSNVNATDKQLQTLLSKYKRAIQEIENPLHQEEWPLGIKQNRKITPRYIGAFQDKKLVGVIGYTTFYSQINNEFVPLEVWEIMLYVLPEHGGQGIAGNLWHELVKLARKQNVPLKIGNNTKGGDASLRKKLGDDNVSTHKVTVVH